MNVPEIESRPQLEINPAVRAFGLPREPHNGLRHFLDEPGIEEIVRAVPENTRVVIIDLRQVRHLSADTLVALIALRKRLARLPSQLVLYAEDAGLRTALRDAEMERFCLIVGSERELTERVGELCLDPRTDDTEPPPAITAEDLAAARTAGITLDDIIRELEQHQP
jgi:anti-anti-sigma regulatory factor